MKDHVVKSRRTGKPKWYWLIDLATEQWTSNRAAAKKFTQKNAGLVAGIVRRAQPDFDVAVEPAQLRQVRS